LPFKAFLLHINVYGEIKVMITNHDNEQERTIMKRLLYTIAIFTLLLVSVNAPVVFAEHKEEKQGPYLVVEGMISQISARSLVVDGQQYPISMYARVFMGSKEGQEMSLQMVVNVGKIDLAKLYIIGGKVEKIMVLQNI